MTRRAPLLLCLAIAPLALAAADGEDVVRLSEPVAATADWEEFGARVDDSGEPVSLQELVAAGDEHAGQDVLLKTRIAKVCRKKGCFFIARDGDAVARITFKDYGFFIPTDSAGKEVLLNGTFERREITAAQARHYREDLGEDLGEDAAGKAGDATAARTEYHIVATAVRIPKG